MIINPLHILFKHKVFYKTGSPFKTWTLIDKRPLSISHPFRKVVASSGAFGTFKVGLAHSRDRLVDKISFFQRSENEWNITGAFGTFKVGLAHSRDRLIDKISFFKDLKMKEVLSISLSVYVPNAPTTHFPDLSLDLSSPCL
jgi:hypothetical protein